MKSCNIKNHENLIAIFERLWSVNQCNSAREIWEVREV